MALFSKRKKPEPGRGGGPLIRVSDAPRLFDRHIFICGLHRSGTTLLEQMLHAAYDLGALRCDDVPENEGQHLQDVYPAAKVHGGVGRFAFAPEMHPAPLSGAEAEAARTRIMACWTPWLEGEGEILLEKSPPNLTKIDWLRSVFPGSKFVVLSRDPRAVAAATQKWSKMGIDEMVFHWHVAYSAALETKSDDCVFTSYEAICADPMGELERIAGALDLPGRSETLSLPERFATLKNSNADYLSALPARRYGPGAWDVLGYELG